MYAFDALECLFSAENNVFIKLMFISSLGSHVGTGFKPLKWTVEKEQVLHQICACKYTRDPPYCDATHSNLPLEVQERQKNCAKIESCHNEQTKLCTGCGWIPDFLRTQTLTVYMDTWQ